MISYANLHFSLERSREVVPTRGQDGPRVLVLGPENAGKTSLVKLLSAYAIRSGRQPVAVNLDPKESMLSIPGSLSAAIFSSIIDVEEGWGSSPTNGPTPVPVKLPLVYYLGLANPEDKTSVYKPIITRLALSVMNRLQDDKDAKGTGCIIDTPGVISQGKGGYEVIQHVVSEFSGKLRCFISTPERHADYLLVSVIVVLGSERLYSDMLRKFNGHKTSAGETIAVIKLDKSGGCVDRDEAYLEQFRQSQIREYFFGDAKSTLSPHIQQIDFDSVRVYKLAECKITLRFRYFKTPLTPSHPASALLNSLLPGDATEDSKAPSIFDQVQPSPQMQNAIIAIVHAEPGDSQENIRDASVIGFIYVAEVDEKRRKMKVLAPLSGRLPNKALVWGAWPDGVSDLAG